MFLNGNRITIRLVDTGSEAIDLQINILFQTINPIANTKFLTDANYGQISLYILIIRSTKF